MREKFREVLSGIDESWLSISDLEVFFTGGGASLRMVTRLAEQPIEVGERKIKSVSVAQLPRWLEEECEDVVGFYPQLAVCIGGACHGAGHIDLDMEQEFERFGGDLPDAQWQIGGFRDGQ